MLKSTKIKILVSVLVIGLSFGIGRYSILQETTVTTNTVTSKTNNATEIVQENSAKSETEQSTVVSTQNIIELWKTQYVLKQDKDTDCTENFDLNTGKLIKRRCVTKTVSSANSDVVTSKQEDKKDVTENVNTNTETDTTTTDKASSETENTTTSTSTVTKIGNSSGFGISGIANLGLLDQGEASLTSSYGVSLSKSLIGPLRVGASIYTNKEASLFVGLKLNQNILVTALVGMNFENIATQNFSAAFYGGSLDYRFLGPLWIGVWGHSDKSAGISASFSIP